MPEENYKSFVYESVEDFKIQYIESNVIIHFRPAKDWLGKGYGFDWMRECDYSNVSPNNALGDRRKYEETISKLYREKFIPSANQNSLTDEEKKSEQAKIDYDAKNPNVLTKNGKTYLLEEYVNEYRGKFVNDPESFYILEKMYNYHQIPLKKLKTRKWYDVGFEAYNCPWMSIYPEKSATLSLIAEQLSDQAPDSYEFDYNKDFFDVSLLKEADLKKLIKGKKQGIPDAVTIKCLAEFDKDQIISIYTLKGTKRKLAGKLYVWSNETAKQKKANVVSIIVNTKKIEFTKNDNNDADKDNNVIFCRDLNAEYLKQALIELKNSEVITLDVSDDIHFKPRKNTGEGGHYYKPDGSGLVGYYTTGSKWKEDPVSGEYRWFYNNAPEDFVPLAKYIYKKLKEHLAKEGETDINKYDNYLKVYYFDQRVYNTNGTTFGGLGGYSQPDDKAVVLPANTTADTLAHEILHAFNLMHSFNNKEFIPTSKFAFESRTTDNLMDYSHLAYTQIPMNSLWQWQWIIANQSIMPDGSIKTIKTMQDEHIIIPI